MEIFFHGGTNTVYVPGDHTHRFISVPILQQLHLGTQGNTHLFENLSGNVESIWTDDERVTDDLSVYILVSGTYPGGTWSKITLPPKINTAAREVGPFFNGSRGDSGIREIGPHRATIGPFGAE